MARFEKTLDNLKGIAAQTGQLRAAPAGGALDPKAVAEALDQYLKSGSASVARSIANSIGVLISKAIRGRGQIDFRRTT
jgi:hypothetical protein